MPLELYFHPLSSFCQKVLVALYENATPFVGHIVDLTDPASKAALEKIWPVGKFPVLRDNDRTIPESSVIVEYLGSHYPGKNRFIPEDPELAHETRLRDRFYDLYVNVPMQKIITDRLRPPGQSDAYGVEQARASLATALAIVDAEMAGKTWAVGETFSMADCAAAPALFYANMVMPLAGRYENAAAYLHRLMARPSYARALEEAKPYLSLVPRAPEQAARA